MVSTRNHPTPLQAPQLAVATSTSSSSTPNSTPTRSSPRRRATASSTTKIKTSSPNISSKATSKPRQRRLKHYPSSKKVWTYTPTPTTILWLLISLPLVAWDTIYIYFRPHTFKGGWLYSPFYVPYDLYGKIDLIYGREIWELGEGFTAAQGTMNLFETALYVAVLWIVWRYGDPDLVGDDEDEEDEEDEEGKGEGWATRTIRRLGLGGGVQGKWAGVLCLCGFASSVMTLGKTTLYVLNHLLSNSRYQGQTDLLSLLFVFIIPTTGWIVFPIYMIYIFARDILRGLAIASSEGDE